MQEQYRNELKIWAKNRRIIVTLSIPCCCNNNNYFSGETEANLVHWHQHFLSCLPFFFSLFFRLTEHDRQQLIFKSSTNENRFPSDFIIHIGKYVFDSDWHRNGNTSFLFNFCRNNEKKKTLNEVTRARCIIIKLELLLIGKWLKFGTKIVLTSRWKMGQWIEIQKTSKQRWLKRIFHLPVSAFIFHHLWPHNHSVPCFIETFSLKVNSTIAKNA